MLTLSVDFWRADSVWTVGVLTLILNCCCTDVHRVDFFRADSLGVDFCLLSLSFGWTFSTLAVIVWTFTGLSYSVDFDSADAHGVDFCHADFHSLDSCYTDCRSADFLLHSLLLCMCDCVFWVFPCVCVCVTEYVLSLIHI